MEAILNREIIVNKTAVRVTAVAAFVILTCLGAFVRFPLPFTPVPVTLQTFFVLLSGAFLGSGMAVAGQAGYLLLGVLGLPVFSGYGSGIAYLFGPTGGYILGFVAACFLVGRLIKHAGNDFLRVFAVFSAADFILLACGAAWLKVIYGYPLARALVMGFLPFVPGDLFKALIASGIYLRLKPRLKELF